jgi:pSer/pThr/pTyr-binding forkhead associated (FHA) protein
MKLEHGGRRVSVTADELIIGSGADSALVVEGLGVLPAHARVRARPDGVVEVAPAGPGALLLLNGRRIGPAPATLAPGDRIVVGDQEIVALDPSAPTGAFQRLTNTMMGMPVMTPEMRAEMKAQMEASPAPAPAPAPGTAGSPATRVGLLVFGVAVAALIIYFLLFRS